MASQMENTLSKMKTATITNEMLFIQDATNLTLVAFILSSLIRLFDD